MTSTLPLPPSPLITGRFFRFLLPMPPGDQLKLGQRAPDFSLPGVGQGDPIRLAHYWGDRPVVLAFTRIFTERHYCPLCFPHLVALQEAHALIQQAGAELLLITSLDLAQGQRVKADLGLTMAVLCDPQGQVFRRYGSGQALGAPLPTQVVLDRYGRVRFWHRFSFLVPNATPQRLLYALSTLPTSPEGEGE